MNKVLIFIAILISSGLQAQYQYEPNFKNPFGLPNPDAPSNIKDYKELIGISNCESIARGSGSEWGEPVDMTWEFKYIMNGMAVQDQTLKEDGTHSGSIRMFSADSSKWYIYYYSTTGVPETLQTWTGNRIDDKIILYKDQKSPNGYEGFYKITFSGISDNSFNWLGEWVSTDESIKFPVWKISCTK